MVTQSGLRDTDRLTVCDDHPTRQECANVRNRIGHGHAPREDGYSFIRKVRAMEIGRDVPAVRCFRGRGARAKARRVAIKRALVAHGILHRANPLRLRSRPWEKIGYGLQ